MRYSCPQGSMPVQPQVCVQPCQDLPTATPCKHLLLLTAMVLSWAALTPPIALRCPATCSRRAADLSSSSATRERSMPICTHCKAKTSGPACSGAAVHGLCTATRWHSTRSHDSPVLLQAANWDLPANAQVLTLVLSILYTVLLCLVAGHRRPGGAQPSRPTEQSIACCCG